MENNTPKINILSQHVINKIAAGEVIERPASVVKELVENAIDAKATKIDIYLEDSGKKLIKVTDNGSGMEKEDVSRSILSHATSKLEKVEDVYTVKTMGFRGEALPSIGSISRMSILSRTKDTIIGSEIEVDGGNVSVIKEKGCSVGTQIEVHDLFFNTPVRRKFLKSNPVEMSHISEIITRIALTNYATHFNLFHNGKTVFNLPCAATIKERIITFFGSEIGKNMISFKSEEPWMVVRGYILPPSTDCRTTKMQYVFINNRYIRDKSIFQAITEAYRGMLMPNRKPIVFLFLEMDPQDFDVNVHPTKIEVRFKDMNQIFGKIAGSIKEKLIQSDLVVPTKIDSNFMPGHMVEQSATSTENRPQYNTPAQAPVGNSVYNKPDNQLDLFSLKKQDISQPGTPFDNSYKPQTSFNNTYKPQENYIENLRPKTYIQIQNSYIVEEDARGINIIDQHALHEIVLYEEIRQKAGETKILSQQLLIPEPVELTASEFYIIISLKEKLGRLGFVIEDFGKNTIIVRAFPQILKNIDCKEFIKNLLSEVDESICKENVDDCMEKLARITACRGAIKMGQKLKDQEIVALLEKRDKMIFTNNCPHGRPTTILMSYEELEKQFKRR